ncbi:MAG: FAD-binding oxidoreductase [Granulosicoccus sp.]|nr:FAD-binding oxidoreductase [Granulosicoccus sp.]
MAALDKFSAANTLPYWSTTVNDSDVCKSAQADTACELAIIGGGFTGLWSAIKARERYPDAHIVLLEAGLCGHAASGQNGGFCAPSISHGVANALARWPQEAEALIRLGRENLDALAQDLETYEIDAEFALAGKLNVAATPWQIKGLHDMAKNYKQFGITSTLLEGEALNEKLASPTYKVGLFEPNYGLVNPAKLVAGLRKACLDRGIFLYENTHVSSLRSTPQSIVLNTEHAAITARKVIMATNAARPLLKRLHCAVIPVFDYSLVTEPLSDAQLAGIGWTGSHGVADCGNQFHYSRKTRDNRVLWAGFDAIYHYGSNRDPAHLQRPETFALLAQQFAGSFPTLVDVRFDFKWGGIIDTSARTTFFSGTAYGGRLSYAMGFTGQGVTASRFAALTMLDLLDGADTERTCLQMVSQRPPPFPPEPLRTLLISQVQKRLEREDRTGHRALLLRLFDALGIGFDS